LRLEQDVFTRRGEYEEKNKSNIARQVKSVNIMITHTNESKQTRNEKYYNLLKLKWRQNLKYRNLYKNLLSTFEKVVDIHNYRNKVSSFIYLRINSLKQSPKVSGGSDKLQNAQQLIVNKEKELELNWTKSSCNSLAVVKDTLLNNQDVFNKIYADENL